jgi:osmotically-inducible protein OsmY
MNNSLLRAAFAALFAATALAACDRDANSTLGQKVDSAVSRTQAELSKAGHEARQELSQAGEKMKPALQDAGEKTRAALNDVGNKVQAKTEEVRSNATSGEGSRGTSDAAITASIKTDYLKDPDLSVLKIDVDTHGGVVTLNGLANDEAARSRAEKLATAVKGVREVRNFLVIKRA